MMSCTHIKDDGTPCRATLGLDENGKCPAHGEGAHERMSALGARGGEATRQKYATPGFTVDELVKLTTHEDAKAALEQIRNAVMTRRVTHAEGNAASKAVSEWVKADQAGITKSLVTELRAELDAKQKEIETLRRQLHQSPNLRRA